MSAIVGVLGPAPSGHSLHDVIRCMLAALKHRGADGIASYLGPDIALACGRIGTVDEPGEQPVRTNDGSLVAVLDGEILNQSEVRVRLGAESPQARSSAALLLHLYRRDGPSGFHWLDGAFAVAVYDARRRLLCLARDRVGERPLYYTRIKGTLFFASGIEAFRSVPGFSPQLSRSGLVTYFAYTQTVAPYSLYKDVKKIVPAHYLVISPDGSESRRAYWTLDYTQKSTAPLPEAREELRHLLGSAVARLTARHRVSGVALSGGVDSSTVVGILREMVPGRIPTFTLGDTLGADLEYTRASAIAARHATEPHTYEFGDVTFDQFREAICHYDEPIGIFDAVHYLRLFERAREETALVLTGNGADSLFAGSKSYSRFFRRTLLRQMRFRRSPKPKERIRDYLGEGMRLNHRATAARLFEGDMAAFAIDYDIERYLEPYTRIADYNHVFDANQFTELFVRQTHLLTIDDTVGAANSIRVSTPFFDRRVLEFAARLPHRYKIALVAPATRNKLLLRYVAQRYMPRELVWADKFNCGNFIDYEQKMRTVWRKEVEAFWHARATILRDILSPAKLAALWKMMLQGGYSEQEHYAFRKVFVFLVWHEQAFDRTAPRHALLAR